MFRITNKQFYYASAHFCTWNSWSWQPEQTWVKEAWATYVLLIDITRRHSLANSLSLADFIGDTGALLALLDVVIDLSAEAFKHSLRLPDFRVRFRVLKRLQVDRDALSLSHNLDVFVMLRQPVWVFGHFVVAFLEVNDAKGVDCNCHWLLLLETEKRRLIWISLAFT